ncbi:cuticle protein 16.8 [Trichonephila clavipes]|nr:cuticle protein 16.8 [Trichonephila clavipes]
MVYVDKPQTFDDLEDNIRHVIAEIRPQMLEKVIENWTSRLGYIRASRGSPMPKITFKIMIAKHHHPQPYKFGYEIKDHHGSQHRHEHGDGHGHVQGSYGFTDHRGVHREVHYVADHQGFRATVKTNEPGTANQDPAHVKLHSSAHHAALHHVPQHHEQHHQQQHHGHQQVYHHQAQHQGHHHG